MGLLNWGGAFSALGKSISETAQVAGLESMRADMEERKLALAEAVRATRPPTQYESEVLKLRREEADAAPPERSTVKRDGRTDVEEWDPKAKAWKVVAQSAEAQPDAPTIRDFVEGDETVVKEYRNGKWEEVSRGPRFEKDEKSDGAPSGYRRTADGNLEPIPGGPGDLRNTDQGFRQENSLRDEYQARSKDFVTIQDAHSKLASVEDSPAGDLSRLYSYMKMLDPGSVVRESEFEIASTARPLLERMGVSWDAVAGIWRGERMTPSMRSNFLKEAENIYNSAERQQQTREEQYNDLARQYQLEPSRVTTGIRTSPKRDSGMGGDAADAISQARSAIARGADRAAVIKRLRDSGITPPGDL